MNSKEFRAAYGNILKEKGYSQLKSPGYSFIKDEPDKDRVIWFYSNSKNNYGKIAVYRIDFWVAFTPISDILGPILKLETLRSNRKDYYNFFGITLQGENNLLFKDGKFHKLETGPKGIEIFQDPQEALNHVEIVYQKYYHAFIERMTIQYLYDLLKVKTHKRWSNSINYCTEFARLILAHKLDKESYDRCLYNIQEQLESKQHLEDLNPRIYFGEEITRYDRFINEIFESVTHALETQ